MTEHVSSTQVWEGVVRITAPNPGPKTLMGTNLYVVGDVLIDAGPSDARFIGALAAFLQGKVSRIFLTHTHPDHAGGADGLARALHVPVFLSQDANLSGSIGGSDARTLEPDRPIKLDDRRLTPLAMPGHVWDHLCFWLQPDGLLFSGDNILGEGTTLIALPEGDMVAYMKTLERTRSLAPVAIAPGHGPMISNPITKIDEYIGHRRQREAEILSALLIPRTIEEIVDIVYRTPDRAIRSLASLSVGAQLAKLETENRITLGANGFYQTRADS